MERRYLIAAVAVLVVTVGAMALRALVDPLESRREMLAADLAEITPVDVKFEGQQANYERWKQTIEGKPSVWQELVPEPPPPPKAPEAPPNTKQMLAGLKVTRQGIGAKVRILTAENPKGVFLGPGDSINGMKVKEVTKASVTFSLEWNGQELTEVVQRD